MSDPRSVVPYHDPRHPVIPFGEQLLHFFQTHNPTLADLTQPNISLPPTNYFQNAQFPPPRVPAEHACAPVPPPTPATSGHRPLDPFEDRVLWSFAHGNNNSNNYNNNNAATASFGSSNESNTPLGNKVAGNNLVCPSRTAIGHRAMAARGLGEKRDFVGKDATCTSSKRPVVIHPETPPTYSCTCCQVLRQITHTNGNHTVKLELHGRLGIIIHGIVENSYYHGMPAGCRPYEMFDFTKRSLEEVKGFLQQYMDERKLGRYMMLEDPLTPFYEAVCVGLMGDPMNSEDFFDDSSSSGGDEVNQMDIQGPAAQLRKSPSRQKPSLADQRERAAVMTALDVAAYFHMPIEKASKRLMLCPTVVKKICRRGGVRRWPYRKVKSLDNKISKLRVKFERSNPEDRACVQSQIQSAQRELDVICFGVTRVCR